MNSAEPHRCTLAECERSKAAIVEAWGDSDKSHKAHIAALDARNARLRGALESAMQSGIELGTADPAWVVEARAALGSGDADQTEGT